MGFISIGVVEMCGRSSALTFHQNNIPHKLGYVYRGSRYDAKSGDGGILEHQQMYEDWGNRKKVIRRASSALLEQYWKFESTLTVE